MVGKSNAVLLIIALASLLLMGQTGCNLESQQGTPQGTTTGQQYQSTSASSQGVDFSFLPGIGFLTEGVSINQGDTFKVGMHIENYDSKPKSGQVCIKDNLEDSYGGVPNTCQNPSPFYVREATMENGKVTQSSKTDVYFPESAQDYSYHDMPINQQAQLSATLQYAESSRIVQGVTIPGSQSETLSLSQNPAPISLAIQKTVSTQGSNYNTAFKITLSNQVSSSEIWTSDFKKKGLMMEIALDSAPITCTSIQNGYVDIETSSKDIICSALVPQGSDNIHFLTINLDYAVKLNKAFSYTIQKGAAA